MPPPVSEQLNSTLETLYRTESGRVLATLVRLVGDLDSPKRRCTRHSQLLWSPGPVAMSEGPEQGLRLIDDLLARDQLSNYYLAHSARADLCRRLGRITEARASYERALSLASQEPDRRFLTRRIAELK